MANRGEVDWVAIRAEYIAGGISLRKIAKKYGVSYGTLGRKANAEKWASEKHEADINSLSDAYQKKADAVVNNAVIAMRIRQKLLDRLEKEINALPEHIGTNYHTNKSDIEYGAGKGNRPTKQKDTHIEYRLRDLTAAWKDLTEGLVIAEESPLSGESGFTEALKGVAAEAWEDNEAE